MKNYAVPIIFLAGTLFFGYLYIRNPKKKEISSSINSTHSTGHIIYGQLQQYQKETSIKTDLQKKRAEMNKKLNNSEIGETFRNPFHQTKLIGANDPRMDILVEESVEEAMNLDQHMDQFLAKRQRYENMESATKKAYVDQFIREAYRMGFIVKVNDQMEIESVVEIKTKRGLSTHEEPSE